MDNCRVVKNIERLSIIRYKERNYEESAMDLGACRQFTGHTGLGGTRIHQNRRCRNLSGSDDGRWLNVGYGRRRLLVCIWRLR